MKKSLDTTQNEDRTMKFMHLTAFVALALCATPLFAAEPDVVMPTPPMSWPLAGNPHPFNVDTGLLGKVYVTGAVSGLAYTQSNATATDNSSRLDFTNAFVSIQNTTGPVQFFTQIGGYALPSLGTPYLRADAQTDVFGMVPQAYVKLVPTDEWSLQIGKMATLIGNEYNFTMEDQNIERGLLWNQENAISRGIQLNYASGPVSAAVSLNDGYYSEHYSWLTAMLTYNFDANNVLTVSGGGNMDESNRATVETPLLQNNSQVYDAIYTHKMGAWTLSPYVQYSYVPKNASVGITDSSGTMGAALLVSYAVNDRISLPVRAEYIDSLGNGGSNLLYGTGSNAWSFTVTPTYQQGIYFGRAEASYVKANDTTAGAAFGKTGDNTSQGRLMVETGVVF